MASGMPFRPLLLALIGTVATIVGIWAATAGPDAKASSGATSSLRIVAAARGVVDVKGGMVRISPQCTGTVTAVDVGEGAKVKSGDILAKIDDKPEVLAESMAGLELDKTEAHLEGLELKKKGLSRRLNRLRRAAEGKAVSTQEVDEAQDTLAELLLQIDEASSEVAIAQSRLNMATRALRLCVIRSPVDGIVVHRGIRAGEVVSPGSTQEVFTVLPDAPKIVRAEFAEKFLDAVAVGMPVEIVPEYDMTRSLGGRIARISSVVTQPNLEQDGMMRSDVRTSTVIITVDTPSLIVGQRVVVRVVR